MSERCQICDGEGWVCEAHPDMPWREPKADKRGCECEAGMPCRACNPSNQFSPPRDPPGFEVVCSANDPSAPEEKPKPN